MPSIRYSVDVHYTWAGPLREDDRDITGPLRIDKELGKIFLTYSYQLYFWCLDEYCEDFRRKFMRKGIKNFTIRGIQSFLRTCTTTTYVWWYWYGKKEIDIVSKISAIVAESTRDRTSRTFMNIKNVWSFFLLYTWGGYHFDTGIVPHSSRKLNLLYYKNFKAPADLSREIITFENRLGRRNEFGISSLLFNMGLPPSWFGDGDGEETKIYQPDVWAMYSPRYSHQSWHALAAYCLLWEKLQAERQEDHYDSLCREIVISALCNGLMHDKKGRLLKQVPRNLFFDAGALGDGTIDEIGIKKNYYGMHSNERIM